MTEFLCVISLCSVSSATALHGQPRIAIVALPRLRQATCSTARIGEQRCTARARKAAVIEHLRIEDARKQEWLVVVVHLGDDHVPSRTHVDARHVRIPALHRANFAYRAAVCSAALA